jgi:hypothetical protein
MIHRRLFALTARAVTTLLEFALSYQRMPPNAPLGSHGGLTVQQLNRMRRVTDQMLTAHSRLRDHYRRGALSLSLTIIALSIAASSLAFAAGDSAIAILHVHARLSRWVAVLSLVIFFLSMADLVLDWRVRAREHDDAARRLGDLKQRLRIPQVHAEGVVDGEGAESEYERTMSLLPPIPDTRFASLKARHAYKVALSRAIDAHPGAPTWWLRLTVRWAGIRGRQVTRTDVTDDNDIMLVRGAAGDAGTSDSASYK